MAAADLRGLLRWYPPAWRDHYGEEFVVYMQDSFGSDRLPLAARLSVVVGGIRERSRRSGLTGDSVPPPDRVRAGILMVLVSWTAMVIAGSSFAKMSEHFDTALHYGAGAHHLPDVAYTVTQTVAGVGALIGLAGVGFALPAFVRNMRSGGWPSIHAHVLRAAGCTLITAGITAPLVAWAHHLSDHQRNGGSITYLALFLGWAALVMVTLILWTVLAVAAARRITFSRRLLATEAAMAIAMASAIAAILTATTLWWVAMAERAPSFVGRGPSSPLDARLVVTAVVMAMAAAAAIAGVTRIVRCLPEWRAGLIPR